MSTRLVLLLALAACGKSEPTQVEPARAPVTAPAAPVAKPKSTDPKILDALPLKDLVGYLSGFYGTSGNIPAIYADLDRKMFVMMGRRGSAELPMTTKPAEASAAFEAFLVRHGYAANGKAPTDEHQRVMVNGKEMVVMTTAELFPTMSSDLKSLFTEEQSDLLYNTTSRDGYTHVAAKVPVMYCGSTGVTVSGPNHPAHDVPIAKANDAFAEFRSLLPKTR